MEVVEYRKEYKPYFIQFNTDWITDNFGHLEADDFRTFDAIDQMVEDGAMIYFAVESGEVLATCMTHWMEGDTWEMCKLASNKHASHKGAGSAVFQAAMQYAIAHGAGRLFMISNSRLKPALHIYEKHGFQEVKLDDYEYERGDIAFEYVVPR